MTAGHLEKWPLLNYLPSQTNFLIPVFLVLIFIIDLITPLGFAVWILYFFPLILTVNMKWEKGSVVVGGFIIILTWIAFFISPSGSISHFYATLNRIFFSLIIVILVVLCSRIVKVNAIYDTYKIYYYEHMFKLK
jgi:ABC-type multidrug transport system fused ATPase/permease subunit